MSKRVEKNRRSVKRPSSEQIEAVIISTVCEDLLEHGFRAVTIESISAKTGIAKTSIYRRWPNKAAMVMEAFLLKIGPGIEFPRNPSYVESIRLQDAGFGQGIPRTLRLDDQGAPWRSPVRWRNWLRPFALVGSLPRREAAKEVIQSAIRNKELRPDVNLDQALDALYGWLYYRLMIGSGPLSDACVRDIFSAVLDGLRVRKD